MKKFNKLMLAALAVCSIAASCEKSSDMTLPLAVDSRYIVLEATTGTTQVRIYSTSEWDVSFASQVDWASLDKLKGAGNSFVNLSYAKNYGIHRALDLVIKAGALSDTVCFVQKGVTPVLAFKGSQEIGAGDTSAEFALTTNLGEYVKDAECSVRYVKYLYNDEDEEDVDEPEGGWITDVSVADGVVKCVTTQNTGASRPRKAEITLSYTDVYDTLHETTATLVQKN